MSVPKFDRRSSVRQGDSVNAPAESAVPLWQLNDSSTKMGGIVTPCHPALNRRARSDLIIELKLRSQQFTFELAIRGGARLVQRGCIGSVGYR